MGRGDGDGQGGGSPRASSAEGVGVGTGVLEPLGAGRGFFAGFCAEAMNELGV